MNGYLHLHDVAGTVRSHVLEQRWNACAGRRRGRHATDHVGLAKLIDHESNQRSMHCHVDIRTSMHPIVQLIMRSRASRGEWRSPCGHGVTRAVAIHACASRWVLSHVLVAHTNSCRDVGCRLLTPRGRACACSRAGLRTFVLAPPSSSVYDGPRRRDLGPRRANPADEFDLVVVE